MVPILRSAKLDGARFKALTRKLKAKGARSPRALAAAIGRKKFGKARFQELAAAGRKRRRRKSGNPDHGLKIETPGITPVPTRPGGGVRGDVHAVPVVSQDSFIRGSDGELPIPGFVTSGPGFNEAS